MKIKTLLINSLFLIGLHFGSYAQQGRGCSTMDHLHNLEQADPGLTQKMQTIERETEQWISKRNTSNQKSAAVITIPVVVNVVYNTTAENVSDAQILSQIAILNQDFRKLNADISLLPSVFGPLASDCEIEFCLAQRDPSGNPTTGIRRQSTSTTSFSTNDNMKNTSTGGLTGWPYTSYLNIWVCDLSNGLLGYATFPGTATTTDGVVIDYQAFGNIGSAAAPFNKGRTATHEIGHWLNLRHIWGDANCGNDQVTDTPTQQTSNYGCPAFPKVTCSNGPNGDMFMNYMDYTDDACMYMFTAGQKSRMLASLNSTRASLLSSLGCVPPSTSSCGTPTGLTSGSIGSTSATISWSAVTGASYYGIQYRRTGTTTWSVDTTTLTSRTLSGLLSGSAYEYQVRAICGTTTGAWSTTGTFNTTSTSSCGTPTNLSAASITTSSAVINWTAVSGAISYNIAYRVNGTTTLTTVSVAAAPATITGLSAGTTYQYSIQAVCSSATGTASGFSTFTTASTTPPCTDPYEPNNSRTAGKTVAVNTDLFAIISSSTDQDWFKFSTTTTAKNVKVVLDQLPLDYDLKLYSSTGTLLVTSQASGTTAETIIRNSTSATTYYVQVYGYGGAFNSSACYRLRINTSGTNFRQESLASVETEINPEKVLADQSLTVFPNPANESLNYGFNAENPEVVKADIVDMLGKVVQSSSVQSSTGYNQSSIDISGLNNGIYFIRLQRGDESLVRKFIVKH